MRDRKKEGENRGVLDKGKRSKEFQCALNGIVVHSLSCSGTFCRFQSIEFFRRFLRSVSISWLTHTNTNLRMEIVSVWFRSFQVVFSTSINQKLYLPVMPVMYYRCARANTNRPIEVKIFLQGILIAHCPYIDAARIKHATALRCDARNVCVLLGQMGWLWSISNRL